MILHCKFNYRTDEKGQVFSDWCTIDEAFPVNGIDLIVDSIEIDYSDFSAQIHCHEEATKKHYTLIQRNIHSFLEIHDA